MKGIAKKIAAMLERHPGEATRATIEIGDRFRPKNRFAGMQTLAHPRGEPEFEDD